MKKPAKVMRAEAREVDGRLCFVLIGKDGAGRPVELAIPAEGLQPVYAEAVRRLDAYRAQQGREQFGEYHTTVTSPGTPATVGTMTTTDGETVVLIVRQGTPAEMNLSFSPSDARALARAFDRMADQAEQGEGPARH